MRQNILSFILLTVIAAAGYWWWNYARVAPPEVVPLAVAQDNAKVDQYRQLKNLKFDSGIYSDPLFLSLRQFSSGPSGVIPHGRVNPFLPF